MGSDCLEWESVRTPNGINSNGKTLYSGRMDKRHLYWDFFQFYDYSLLVALDCHYASGNIIPTYVRRVFFPGIISVSGIYDYTFRCGDIQKGEYNIEAGRDITQFITIGTIHIHHQGIGRK